MAVPRPSDPTAAERTEAMDQPEFTTLAELVAAVLRRLTAIWTRAVGPVTMDRRDLRSRAVSIADAAVDTGDVVRIEFPPEWDQAVDDGLDEIIDAMDRAADSVRRVVDTPEVRQSLDRVKAERARLVRVHGEMAKNPGHGFRAAQVALTQPAHLKTEVKGVVSDHLVAEHEQEQIAEARRRGPDWVLVWVSERDACVHCTRLNGEHISPGGMFDWTLTYGTKAYQPKEYGPDGELHPTTLRHPPRHPHCRCELSIVHKDAVRGVADALRREAARSIAKGWARESEGESVRVSAARRLVESQVKLPKSVIAETRRRLGRPGTFKRPVPSSQD